MIRRFRVFIRVLIRLAMFWIGSVLADEVPSPSAGLLYNTKETNSLTYRCQSNHDNSLNCEFTQTSVRKKAKPVDLRSALNQARKAFHHGARFSAEKCKTYKGLVDVFEGRKTPSDEERLNGIIDMQKKRLSKNHQGHVKVL